MKICFLVSGGGGNLKFIHQSIKDGLLQDVELCLIADRSCKALEFAKNNNISNLEIKYKQNENDSLMSALELLKPDLVITNWHKIIDPKTVNKYKGKLINLHYSLLPSFSGLIGIAPIEQAYLKGCGYTGATCHYVDEGVDTGKIIAQAIVRTDVEISKAIDSVFKKGCLILLNTIYSLKGTTDKYQHDSIEYSPPLQFDPQIFNEPFWKKVSQA